MVLEDGGPAGSHLGGDSIAFVSLQYQSLVFVEYDMFLVEGAAFLNDRIKFTSQCSPCSTVFGMRMGNGYYIGASLVDSRMYGERGFVCASGSVCNMPALVNEDEVTDAHAGKVHRIRVDPELLGMLWVSDRHMAGDAFVEAKPGEQA